MLYLVTPTHEVLWWDIPGVKVETLQENNIDLAGLDWQPAKDRTFSLDLLRIALRHGTATRDGIALDVRHTLNLGRADELRLGQQAFDDAQRELAASNGALMEALMPGWTRAGEELDERVRDSTERIAREAEEELAEILAAPVNHTLAAHWVAIGGNLPD